MNAPSAATLTVRAPASSANLGAGFDVLAMALDLYADVGTGAAPEGAQVVDRHHPARSIFERFGGDGDVWLRTNIPMARGLGFSGAVRSAAAALAVVQCAGGDEGALDAEADRLLDGVTADEGHGDNAAASLRGGVVAFVDGAVVPVPVGPVLGSAAFVAWVPDVTTSTDRSRSTLDHRVDRADAVANIGRSVQFALAFAHDDPELLRSATIDRLHQDARLPMIPGAAEAMDAGLAVGAWCSWLSGSGPTIGFLAAADVADRVASTLPEAGHAKILGIDPDGVRLRARP